MHVALYPCHPCLGSPSLEFSNPRNGSPAHRDNAEKENTYLVGSRGNTSFIYPFIFTKENLVTEGIVYLQRSKWKWVSRRHILWLFCRNYKDLHALTSYVTPEFCNPAQSSYFTVFLYPLLLGSFFLWALVLDPWQISEQNSNFAALWFPQYSFMFRCTCTPTDSEHFISLYAEMATSELSYSWSRRSKPSGHVFIEAFNELIVQLNCVYHKIEILQ